MDIRKAATAVRGKVGLVVVGGALLATGVGFGAHAAATSLSTRTTSEVSAVTSPAATSTPDTVAAVTSPEVQSSPVEQATQAAVSSAATQAAAAATTSAPAPAAEPTPEQPAASSTYDPTAPWVQDGYTYVPASPPPAAKLPGEPGYTPPAN